MHKVTQSDLLEPQATFTRDTAHTTKTSRTWILLKIPRANPMS
jgi:hypothetical protein